MPLGELASNPQNAKLHDLDGVQSSIQRFGMVELITLDERTGQIVSGHGRRDTLAMMRDAGEPPPEDVQVKDGEWLVPVVRGWSSKDDNEAAAATVALNRYVETGGWDQGLLADLLQGVAELPGGLQGVGYSNDDLADLLALVAGPPDLDTLASQLGDPLPEDFWPVLRFKVPPELRNRYLAVTRGVGGGDDAQFEGMVRQAENARDAQRMGEAERKKAEA